LKERLSVRPINMNEDPPGAPSSPVSVRTLTDREGEFVLFFKRLPAATQNNIVVRADKDGAQDQQAVTITEGKALKDVHLDLS
jgi:hypothetical protein